MKYLLVLVISIITTIVFAQKSDTISQIETNSLIVGTKLPEFEGVSLNNKVWNNELLKGKVVLINFWYIGCLPCMAEIKHFNELYTTYKVDDFIILSIGLNIRDDLVAFNGELDANPISKFRKILKVERINYEIIPACSDSLKRETYVNEDNNEVITLGQECEGINKDFIVKSFPTTILIDKKGVIKYKTSGFEFRTTISTDKSNYQEDKIDSNSTTQISLPGISGSIDLNSSENGQKTLTAIYKNIEQLLNE